MIIKSSIVIPANGREEKLNRAINSIIVQDNSKYVEIIVVDDFSSNPLDPNTLRAQDKLIRNESNLGAAVSRNRGIQAASGEVIYLLDSDDYFVQRDFLKDHELVSKSDDVYYCDIKSGNSSTCFPNSMKREDFFDFILFKNTFISQTSTLVFSKQSLIKFDESLPKHQDWDLVLFEALLKGRKMLKIDGLVYFDRSDKTSISRVRNADKSRPWIDKLRSSGSVSKEEINLFKFYLISFSKSEFNHVEYFKVLIKLIIKRKITPKLLIVNIIKRYFIL